MIGSIYKIIHVQSDICFVGCTFNKPTYRWYEICKRSKNKSKRNTLDDCLKQYGVEQFKIIVVKQYDVVDREHLLAYKQLWINKLKCANKHESIFSKKGTWKNANKEHCKDYSKQYYQNHKSEIADQAKSKIQCGCGSTYRKAYKSVHSKTKKHLAWLKTH